MKKTTIEFKWGSSIGTILFVIFLVLKLTDTISWSWWWVISPLWIPLAILTLLLLITFLGFIISKD